MQNNPRVATLLTTSPKALTECAKEHVRQYCAENSGKNIVRVIDGEGFKGGMLELLQNSKFQKTFMDILGNYTRWG